MIAALDIKATGPGQPVSGLSGGNQQKVVIARALAREPAVLVAVRPTNGVDVKSKDALLGVVRDVADGGSGAVLVSDELDDLRVCDRVLTVFHGRVNAAFGAGWRDHELVAAIGFGMNDSGVLARLVADLDVDVVLCAGRWTLLERTTLDDLLPVCARRGTSVVVGGVYNSGLLAAPSPGARYDYAPAPPELLARARRLVAVCDEFGVPLKAAALQFPFGHPAVAAAVVGAAAPEEMAENAALFHHAVPDALWHALVVRGLLDAGLPLPLNDCP